MGGWPRAVLSIMVVSLAATGCGTRLTHGEIRAAAQASATRTDAQRAVSATSDGFTGGSPADAAAASTLAADGTAAGSAPRGGVTGPAQATAAAPGSSSVAGQAGTGTSAPRVAAGSPIVIGNVGTYSGPAGSSLADLPEGVQAWVKYINDRGGLNGHTVKLVSADDGADPARHRSLVQQLVETQKVIAFIANGEVLTGAGSVDYLTQKGIPVIGNEGGSDWFYSSPTYFPPAATGRTYWPAVASSVAEVARQRNIKRWASITCTEASTCTDADAIWNDRGEAKSVGLDPVYRARASIAQPDFTAECLNARNARAEIVTLVLDASSVLRVASSCARQGYRPVFTEVAASSKTEHAASPNLADNLVASIGTFVWTDASTPAAAEFQAVMKRYLGKAPGAGHAIAWQAAKVFEKAAAGISEPASPKAVLDGLYGLKDDTFAGLSMPLTFSRGKVATRRICWATDVTQKGAWVPFNQGRITCR
jgi:branched-chain amino acid transport system substrate-binding protein